MLKRLPIPYLYCILIGIALGLIMGAKTYLPFIYWEETQDYQWQRYFLPHFVNNTLWGFLVPIVYYFFEKIPIKKNSSWSVRLKAFGVSLLVAAFHETMSNVLWFLPMHLLDMYPFSEKELNYVIGSFPSATVNRLIEYWIIYALFAALDYSRKFRNKQLELIRMESQLSSAQLNALRLQLQPHFLFNTLNTISSLMEVSIKDARKVVSKLGNMLRTVLEKDKRNTIPLRDELEYIKSYLDIEQVRFQDRLEIRYQIDPTTLNLMLPSLILQPLVENAIRHGFANQSGDGLIELTSRRIDDHLVEISVRDNGNGSAHTSEHLLQQGIGLQNVRDRLQLIYKEQMEFSITSSPNEGFTVSLRLPDRPADSPPNHSKSVL
jgi:two-component system LytT family sensor kinase